MEPVEIMPAAQVQTKPAFEAAFADILAAAQAQVAESKKIVVTDPTDVDGIAESRKYRLAIRQIRIAVE